MTKESLLQCVLSASLADVGVLLQAAQERLQALDAVGVGFQPFPHFTRAAGRWNKAEILEWIATVRQPQGDEFADRPLRNALVYEVEKLGEFCATLQARTTGKLFDYVH